MEFYDCFTDQLKIIEDENSNIITLLIIEDCDDKGESNKASFILDKQQAIKLAEFINNKWK